MKLTIDRISLLRPLGQVQSVVERRNTIPILANVVLQAADGALLMTATDMDMDIATQVECAVGTAGTTTVSAHLLYDIVRKLPDGAEVEIAVADGHAMISAGRSNFRLPTLPVEDFPTISVGDMPDAFAVTAADMRDMIDATRFAISTEETRYYLNGIYIHKSEQGDLCAVATDGHRLALTRQGLPSGAAGMTASRSASASLLSTGLIRIQIPALPVAYSCAISRARGRDPAATESSRSRISGINVSDTNRPPNLPNRPFSSGPVMKLLKRSLAMGRLLSRGQPFV